jgi:hypothetical protein
MTITAHQFQPVALQEVDVVEMRWDFFLVKNYQSVVNWTLNLWMRVETVNVKMWMWIKIKQLDNFYSVFIFIMYNNNKNKKKSKWKTRSTQLLPTKIESV